MKLAKGRTNNMVTIIFNSDDVQKLNNAGWTIGDIGLAPPELKMIGGQEVVSFRFSNSGLYGSSKSLSQSGDDKWRFGFVKSLLSVEPFSSITLPFTLGSNSVTIFLPPKEERRPPKGGARIRKNSDPSSRDEFDGVDDAINYLNGVAFRNSSFSLFFDDDGILGASIVRKFGLSK